MQCINCINSNVSTDNLCIDSPDFNLGFNGHLKISVFYICIAVNCECSANNNFVAKLNLITCTNFGLDDNS